MYVHTVHTISAELSSLFIFNIIQILQVTTRTLRPLCFTGVGVSAVPCILSELSQWRGGVHPELSRGADSYLERWTCLLVGSSVSVSVLDACWVYTLLSVADSLLPSLPAPQSDSLSILGKVLMFVSSYVYIQILGEIAAISFFPPFFFTFSS